MNSPVRSTPSSFSSQPCVWGRLSRASHSLLQARAKELKDEMFYGSGFDPPVNNVIVPNIFNKLDAQCKERTRVMNNVLEKRLDVQERCILRNKDFQERLHARQTAMIKEDLRKMSKRLPSFAKLYKNTDMALLAEQVKQHPVPLSKFSTVLPEERHYCFRYFEHHNPVRIARRVAEGIRKDLKRLEKSMDAKSVVEEAVAPFENQSSIPSDTVQSEETAKEISKDNPDINCAETDLALTLEDAEVGLRTDQDLGQKDLVSDVNPTEANFLSNPGDDAKYQHLEDLQTSRKHSDASSVSDLNENQRKRKKRSRHNSSASAFT